MARPLRLVHHWQPTINDPLSEIPEPSESATRISLLLRIRDVSDNGSWREFVECYGPRVLSWCRKCGLQEADAADAVQMVLLKLVHLLQHFDYDPQQGRFRSWLKTVARHVAIDFRRGWDHRGLKWAGSDLEQVADDQPSPEDELYDAIESGWQEDLLRTAEANIQLRVPPEYWRAYWICCREQRNAQDAANEIGAPVSSIYVAKSRVLKLLREEVVRLDPEREFD